MKQVHLFALTIALCLLFSSCASGTPGKSGEKGSAQIIKAEYESLESIVISTKITADYGTNVFEYRIKYTGSGDSGMLEILSPSQIAGLTATVSSAGSELQYDGAELYAGAVSEDGLSPVWAIPKLIGCWCSGYITQSSSEKLGDANTVAICTDISESTSQKTWFDIKTHLPVKSEIYSQGYTVITCEFENVAPEYSKAQSE